MSNIAVPAVLGAASYVSSPVVCETLNELKIRLPFVTTGCVDLNVGDCLVASNVVSSVAAAGPTAEEAIRATGPTSPSSSLLTFEFEVSVKNGSSLIAFTVSTAVNGRLAAGM